MAYTALSLQLMAEPLRSLDYTAISGTYSGIGTSISHAARILFVQNLTDVILLFSFDGVDDNFRLPPNGYILLDVASNKTEKQGWYIAQGQRFYVKQDTAGAPSYGTIDVTVFYGGGTES